MAQLLKPQLGLAALGSHFDSERGFNTSKLYRCQGRVRKCHPMLMLRRDMDLFNRQNSPIASQHLMPIGGDCRPHQSQTAR